MSALVFHQPGDQQAQDLNSRLAGYLSSLEVHSGTRWYWSVSTCPLDVEPGAEADALIHGIFLRLKETFDVSDHQATGTTYEKISLKAMMVWSTASERLRTKFSLVNFDGGLYAFVSGSSEGPDQGLQPWLDALQFALERSGEHPTHAWNAVLGMPYDSSLLAGASLGADTRLAGISLRKTHFAYEELVPLNSTLNGWRTVAWQPFVVSGRTRGHS